MRAIIFAIATALLLATASAGSSSCGTCESLGYECLSPSHARLDDCGAPLNASTCPVTSCADYCLTLFGVTGGYCSVSANKCMCDTASACDRPLCDRLGDIYAQCIPANATDECATGTTVVSGDACLSTHPPCASGCICSAQGVCECPNSTPSGKAGGASVHSTPVKVAAAVPTITRITSSAKMFVFGSGAIGGTAAQVGVALGVSIAMIYASYHKQHPVVFAQAAI